MQGREGARRVIGALDIGGTHVTAARVDVASASVEGRLRADLSPDGTRDELLGTILGAAGTLDDVERVGVAVPGPFDYEHGIFTIRHKLAALYGVDLRAALGVHTSFVNDADAFLLGEWWAGAARGHERAIGITLGTGLGSAFIAGGELVGEELYLHEFRGAPVEDTISARGLLARYGDEAVDVEQVAARARDGDERARDAFEEVGAALAEFLAPWVASFEPTCVVVGGSIARAWDLLAPPLEMAAPAANVDDAPLLGAALHATRSA
jgi:glucokinase